MDKHDKGYVYEVQGRYDYYAIDLYKDGQCLRAVEAFRTRKQANSVCGELNEAYRLGIRETTRKAVEVIENLAKGDKNGN